MALICWYPAGAVRCVRVPGRQRAAHLGCIRGNGSVDGLRRTKEPVFQADAPMLWQTIWLLPAFATAIVMMFTGNLTLGSVREVVFYFLACC